MPVLRSIRERFARERPLEGLTVGLCLHITSETGCLVRALSAGGASVALCASNPTPRSTTSRRCSGTWPTCTPGSPDEWADSVAAVAAARRGSPWTTAPIC